MAADAFSAVRSFEAALCEYTGAPYAVAVNSCTMALLLACAWEKSRIGEDWEVAVTIPKRTYVGVPMAIRLAGLDVRFEDIDWGGQYQLNPLPVYDAARRFTKDMYQDTLAGTGLASIFQCVSFHTSKILGHSQGGAILHGNAHADLWLRRARFDGRTEGVPPSQDTFDMLGWHCYMSPDVAIALLWKMMSLPDVNPDLPNSDYPDLSKAPIFSGR